MPYKKYSPTFEKAYMRLSAYTGMSAHEIDVFMIKFVKVITSQLNRDGEALVPYLGKFYIKRVPPRRRSIVDFSTEKRFTVKIPASDKLKFRVNRDFSKLFR
jgi:nucleoid DNA-binding protein